MRRRGRAVRAYRAHPVATILAAKGGTIGDITVGDCLELLHVAVRANARHHTSPLLLPAAAQREFPGRGARDDASVRRPRPADREQLIDRYGIDCQPVRDLLVEYLRERQPAVDYSTLQSLA